MPRPGHPSEELLTSSWLEQRKPRLSLMSGLKRWWKSLLTSEELYRQTHRATSPKKTSCAFMKSLNLQHVSISTFSEKKMKKRGRLYSRKLSLMKSQIPQEKRPDLNTLTRFYRRLRPSVTSIVHLKTRFSKLPRWIRLFGRPQWKNICPWETSLLTRRLRFAWVAPLHLLVINLRSNSKACIRRQSISD